MDYSRLSRETLIHEIQQMNNQIEKLKIEKVGQEIDLNHQLDAIQSPVFIIQLDYSVTWANEFCANRFENILGKKCYHVFFGFSDICPGCPMQTVIDLKSSFNTNVFQPEESESVEKIVWRNQLFPLIHHGKVTGIMEIQENIKVQEQHDENYKEIIQNIKHENNELKKKVRRTNEFVGNFTRELQTPVRSLRGFFEAFDLSYLSELQVEYLNVIKSNSDLLFEIMNRLLLNAKYDEGNVRIQKSEFNFKQVIDEVIESYAILFKLKRNNQIKLNYSNLIPEILVGDVTKFRLVLSFLLEASNFLCENDVIVVSVSEITENAQKIHLKITIKDNSEKVMGKVLDVDDYDIQKRVSFDTIEEYALVLGISLAKTLIQTMNGMVEITNVKDKGMKTSIFMTFDKVQLRTKHEEQIKVSERLRILIADSEKPQIPMDYFERFDIYFAKSGDQAIELFFDIDPDLTIIDVMIDHCDGFSVLDEIERRRNSFNPIIAISNKLIDNESEFLKDYGFDDYYPKPLTERVFSNIIENYLKTKINKSNNL